MTIFISIIIISMSISFICSLLEACLLSISLADIAKISAKQPKIANIWQSFKKNINRPLSVIVIICSCAQTIGATLAGAQFNIIFGAQWITIFSILYSYAMIQWTEILPKTLGVNFNYTIAKYIATPLNLIVKIFNPISKFINLLNKPFEGKNIQNKLDTLEEITMLARFALINDSINIDQEKILSQTVNLSSLLVKDIMVLKEDIKFLKTNMSLADALIESHIHHHTRFPLLNEKDNSVLGYINFKDIVAALQLNPSNPSLIGIHRPILTLYEDEKLSTVLSKLSKSYQHIAIVNNSDDEVVGFITLEDIIESMLGAIDDEYDVLPDFIYKINENRYLIGGGKKIIELNKELKCSFINKDINLSEYLISIIGIKPKNETKVNVDNITFIIRKVSRSKIHEIIADIN